MNKIVAGMIGGFVATAPMTAVMVALHRKLPARERYPLPPRKVTMNVADTLQVKHAMDEDDRFAATIAAHFGYGAGAGAVYGAFADRVPGPAAAKGIGWGMIVWSGSYLGLLPALGLHEPATRHPVHRNLLMITAHVVWGATLGVVTDKLQKTSQRQNPPSHPPKRRRLATAGAHS
jgi:uncharacterized membrane protein YagU involved in acid resistance